MESDVGVVRKKTEIGIVGLIDQKDQPSVVVEFEKKVIIRKALGAELAIVADNRSRHVLQTEIIKLDKEIDDLRECVIAKVGVQYFAVKSQFLK